VADTKPFEAADLEAAIERYHTAVAAMREYEWFTTQGKLFLQLQAHWDISILDPLTLCLVKAQRPNEAVDEADRYFEEFPDGVGLKASQSLKARVDKYRS
jgi:hypothetical protein